MKNNPATSRRKKKGIFATDKTDPASVPSAGQAHKDELYLAGTNKDGPGKKPPRFANRSLDFHPDIGTAKNGLN